MARSAVAAVLVAVLACGAFAQENTCFVDAGDGLTVDMTELGAKNWGPISQDSTYSLLLKPCNTLTYDAANMPEGNGFCFDDDMACQLNNKIPSAAAGNTQTKLEYNAATNTTTIELTGGDYCPKLDKYRMVTISLKCGTTASAPKFEDEDECNYIISWTHPAGCPISGGGSSGGLSGGDVFLIMYEPPFLAFFCSD